MKVFMTGATGFIGRAIVPYLQHMDGTISTFVRDTAKARSLLGEEIELLGPETPESEIAQHITHSNVIINLAGAPIIGGRWTKSKKRELNRSRVGITQWIVETINKSTIRPSVLVSASAVGFYGDQGSKPLNEKSLPGSGFLACLCSSWEQAALDAKRSNTRVCALRLGVVLGREGGLLNRISDSALLKLAIRTGSPGQYFPWVHLVDVVRIIGECIVNPELDGVFNCTSPGSVTAEDFAETMKRATDAKFVLGVPSIVLRAILGEASTVITNSQNTRPDRLLEKNFRFQYPSLRDALYEEFNQDSVSVQAIKGIHGGLGDNLEPEGTTNKGHYELRTRIYLGSNAQAAFRYFSSPSNLGMLTPSWMGFRMITKPPLIQKDSEISYQIRLGLFRIQWRTKIIKWEPNTSFVDVQQQGPYSLWQHEHLVHPVNENTSYMEDTVVYRVPMGILGKLVHKLIIKRTLIRIFNYRQRVIGFRFGQWSMT